MEKNDPRYSCFLRILKEELVPAMGCTEPVAIAYCGAKAREVLGKKPERVQISVSGNIIKNVKSVIVPNTGGMKGICAAAAIGIIAGNPEKKLEVISQVTDRQKTETAEFLEWVPMSVSAAEQGELLDITIKVYADGESAAVRIAKTHTHIVQIQKNNEVLYEEPYAKCFRGEECRQETELDAEAVFDFAQTVDLADIHEVIGRQITYNSAVAREGLERDWGANIGKVLLKENEFQVRQRAKAMAAAGSDARMSGCELPVVVNSGSGNQGLTVCLPVLEYANALGSSTEKLYRALVLSNLIAVHQKRGIGCLSAYCGAVSAGAAAGCGIAYLQGGDFRAVAHTLVNALAITSGMICDGAKPSCAAKIAVAVDAGILGYEMYCHGQQFCGGDGIVSKGVENTIRNVGQLGSRGMVETDREIIRIMTDERNGD